MEPDNRSKINDLAFPSPAIFATQPRYALSAPAMLASVAVPPADRHASAIRRFPPGCGRRTNATARLPPRYPLQATAAAAPEPPLPNPSLACAANTTAPPQPTRTRPAAAGPGRGVGSGGKAAAAVTARCVSAVRRYPPGCGRDVAAPKPPASVSEGQGESGVGKTTAVLCTSYAEAWSILR